MPKPKIGRNDPCFCGSGRKFKQCHGGPQYEIPVLAAKERIVREGRRLLERHKLAEQQRQKQQGLGRPILSIEHHGYRFVAVGKNLHYGKWKTFADFLSEYIRHSLGSDWGNAEIAKPVDQRHPVMRWYDRICRLQAEHSKGPGVLFSTPVTGAVSAYHRLAYNLYLIAHNAKDIQTRLISRLKNADNFQGAFYETQVAAWLIKAGFELEFEDETDGTTTHCEFTATYVPTGEKYSVEAKCHEVAANNRAQSRVGRKLSQALAKHANHKRVVFLDLNRAIHTEEEGQRAMDWADRVVKRFEAKKIDGKPAPEAYLCITNFSDQYALDSTETTMMAMFLGFGIHDFMGDQFSSLREAARARERHWPMFQLLKSMETHREIPQTFDGGLPSETFASPPSPRLQVGENYTVMGPDGKKALARLTQAIVFGDKALYAFFDPASGAAWMSTAEMTKPQLEDYTRHPDTYFGAQQEQGKRAETAMDLFDFFAESHRETPKARLIELIGANVVNPEDLSHLDLVEILAERYTWGAIASGFKVKRPRHLVKAEGFTKSSEPKRQ